MQPSSTTMSSPIGSSLPGNSSGSATTPVSGMTSSPHTQRRPYLYIGQLDARVNDIVLKEVFGSVGPVVSTKIVADRNAQQPGSLSYGFIEYADLRSAESALQSLNGRKIFDSEIKVDWATSSLVGDHGALAGGIGNKENTSSHFHVFVGDLAPEINDQMLRQAFQNFASVSEARVMWDASSGKSRGYGFVAFREKADAEQAISTMNGEWLGSRAVRVNWANQKGSTGGAAGLMGQSLAGPSALANHALLQGPNRNVAIAAALGGMGAIGLGQTSMPPTGGAASGTPITYEQAMAGSAPHNTTVYVGNIPPFATQNDLIPLFSQYGYIIEIRMQADRGFAFVKLDTHENAASAIVNLAGQIACGRPIKCGWGKDRNESAMLSALRQGMQLSGYANVGPPQALYGMPQYGFPSAYAFGNPGGPQISGLGQPLDAAALQQMQAAAAHAQAQAAQQQQQQQQQQQVAVAAAAAAQQQQHHTSQPSGAHLAQHQGHGGLGQIGSGSGMSAFSGQTA